MKGRGRAAYTFRVVIDASHEQADVLAAPPSTPLVAVLPAERVAGRRPGWLGRLSLILADTLALVVAFFGAKWLLGGNIGGLTSAGALFVAALPVWIVAIDAASLYDRDDAVIGHSTLDELPRLFQLASVGTLLLLAAAWAASIHVPLENALLFWLLACALLPVVRLLARGWFRRDPDFPQNTVIVGAGEVGQVLARKFLNHPEYQINLLGLVDERPRERRPDLEHLTILGAPDQLPDLIEKLNVERVVIAFSSDGHDETMRLIRVLKDQRVRIDIVPRLFDAIPPRLAQHTIEGVPLLSLPPLHLSRSAAARKRSFDLAVSLLGLVVAAPILAVLALLIKLDSSGPVFFRQLRMGSGDKPFWMFKFRTMVVDADELKADLAHLNEHARPGGDARMFKITNDPRTTRVGRWLRHYSLDELPQLVNVIRGEMSLIGPRPLILEEDSFIEDWGRKRLTLKPGMTGLWQVLGRNAIPFEEMVKLDYHYVTTWSLASDVRLLLKTIPLVARGNRGLLAGGLDKPS